MPGKTGPEEEVSVVKASYEPDFIGLGCNSPATSPKELARSPGGQNRKSSLKLLKSLSFCRGRTALQTPCLDVGHAGMRDARVSEDASITKQFPPALCSGCSGCSGCFYILYPPPHHHQAYKRTTMGWGLIKKVTAATAAPAAREAPVDLIWIRSTLFVPTCGCHR
jgi:hypothetical protein